MTLKILKVKLDIPSILVTIPMDDLLRAHELNITTLHQGIPLLRVHEVNIAALHQGISAPNESSIMMGWRGLQAETIGDHVGGQVEKGPRLPFFRPNRNIIRAKWPLETEVYSIIYI